MQRLMGDDASVQMSGMPLPISHSTVTIFLVASEHGMRKSLEEHSPYN